MARRVKETKPSWIIVIQQMCQEATEAREETSNKCLKKEKKVWGIPQYPAYT